MTDDSTSIKHMARKFSNHDEGEQDEIIMKYLEEVKKKILLNLTHNTKSDSSMCSETSEDMHKAQPSEEESPVDVLKKAGDFLAKLKDKINNNNNSNSNNKIIIIIAAAAAATSSRSIGGSGSSSSGDNINNNNNNNNNNKDDL
ncbi:hypothetical protein H5410_051698 [Solanum commersonii]|uniref:Uncharacterized protein n=1 Tax=Solanum commersonii TaxID=4109 RepID=A0A9J5X082_SOLCO|nr:hypothetical protein H5410_051698 [Solanum commersonii]